MQRGALGPDVDIEIVAIDETNARVRPDRIARQIKEAGGLGLVGFVGVQSNQFPRVMDVARPLRAAGIQVCIGGFHVSGCLAMLPETPDSLKEALDLGISLFAGEAEGRFDEVLRDAAAGTLEADLQLSERPAGARRSGASIPAARQREPHDRARSASFDAGRGCPFLCSFCTIINVQGRKSRYRTADDIEQIVRSNHANGVRYFFITDDNLARNRNWEAIFDRLIELRQEGLNSRFVIQVDTACHKIPRFIEKAAAAGVKRVFIGLENIDPDNLIAAKKKQNHIADYRELLLEWRKHRCITYCGYIIGFPADTPELVVRRIEVIQRELPLDILQFSCLTPLPGCEDHAKAVAAGVDIDSDLNKFDLEHVVTDHPRMTPGRVAGALSHGLPHLLHRRAHEDGDPPRRGRRRAGRHGGVPARDLLGGEHALQHLPAGSRPDPAKSAARPPPDPAGRKPARLLSEIFLGAPLDPRASGGEAGEDLVVHARRPERPEREKLHRRGAADFRRLRPSGDVPALRGRPSVGAKAKRIEEHKHAHAAMARAEAAE